MQAFAFLKYLQTFISRSQLRHFFVTAAVGSAALVALVVVVLTYSGVVAPWSGRSVAGCWCLHALAWMCSIEAGGRDLCAAEVVVGEGGRAFSA